MNLPAPEPRISPGQGPPQGSDVIAILDVHSALTVTPEQKARVLVVEDNLFVRAGVVKLLNRQSDLACCGEADSIASTPSAMVETKPNLLLLDLQLKDGEALGLIKMLKSQRPAVPILVLSQADEGLYAERALRAGADGFIMKQEAAGELLGAIRAVLLGKIYVSRAMAQRLPRDLRACSRIS